METSQPENRHLVLPRAFLGVAVYWLAQPPVGFWPLVFLAPVPWLRTILAERPVERRGYYTLWFAGIVFWLLTMHGTRLSHPALYPAWIALGLYMGAYLPLFVGLSRIAVHKLRWPLGLSAAVIWTGLELVRSYAFTGYSGSMLGHAVVPWTTFFQISDLAGTYLASFAIMLVASGLVCALERWLFPWLWGYASHVSARTNAFHVGAGLMTLVLALVYGEYRLQADPHLLPSESQKPMLHVALLQADAPAIFEPSVQRDVDAFYRYVELSRQAGEGAKDQPLDLVVWPESMFGAGNARLEVNPDGFTVPDEWEITKSEFAREVELRSQDFDRRAGQVQQEIVRAGQLPKTPWLIVGASRVEFGEEVQKIYSTAIVYDQEHRFHDWYGKRHLVMFGEYIPFGHWFPWLYKVLPLSYGVTPGPRLVTANIDNVRLAPSICFETMVEQGANQQVRNLTARGERPDMLVNITNDGWFHGSSILDHHLRSSQATAAAHHIPVLIAANSGITAWIDGSGRIQKSLDRQTEGVLYAAPLRDPRSSLYATVGDWPAILLAVITAGIAAYGWRNRRHLSSR